MNNKMIIKLGNLTLTISDEAKQQRILDIVCEPNEECPYPNCGIPNQETIDAMNETELTSCYSIAELMESLNSDSGLEHPIVRAAKGDFRGWTFKEGTPQSGVYESLTATYDLGGAKGQPMMVTEVDKENGSITIGPVQAPYWSSNMSAQENLQIKTLLEQDFERLSKETNQKQFENLGGPVQAPYYINPATGAISKNRQDLDIDAPVQAPYQNPRKEKKNK